MAALLIGTEQGRLAAAVVRGVLVIVLTYVAVRLATRRGRGEE